jgi:PKD repeat protein
VNGKYFAAKVPVAANTKTITAIATDQTGAKHQMNVAVAVTTQSGYVDLLATPSIGIPVPKQNGPASLHVRLTSSPATTHAVTNYAWDFDGSGSDDLSCYSHNNVTASYQQTGLYLTKGTVRDTTGNKYTDTAIVNVLDKTEMNGFFTQKWDNMKSALSSGNIAEATGHFYKGVQAVYNQQFSEIASSLHMLADKMGSFKLVKVTDNIAEGDLRSSKDGIEYSFQVLFIRDANGDWGILSF